MHRKGLREPALLALHRKVVQGSDQADLEVEAAASSADTATESSGQDTYVVNEVLRLCSRTISMYSCCFCLYFNKLLLALQPHAVACVW